MYLKLNFDQKLSNQQYFHQKLAFNIIPGNEMVINN